MKKRLCAMLLILLTALLCACASQKSAPAPTPAPSVQAQTRRIGYTPGNLNNPFSAEFGAYMQAACDRMGVALDIRDGENDVARQISILQTWLREGYDAVVCSPLEPTTLQPTIDALMETGVAFINLDSECERKTTYLGVNQYNYGYAAGKLAATWIKENLPGQTVRCALLTKPQSLAVIERANGIVDGLTENAPRAEITATRAYSDMESAKQATLEIFAADPSIRLVVGVADVSILGAYQAIKELGLDEGELCLVGEDATSEVLQCIASGTAIRGSVSQSTRVFAQLSVDAALSAIEGQPMDELYMEITPVTPENVDAFLNG